jgi:hypothetical protein
MVQELERSEANTCTAYQARGALQSPQEHKVRQIGINMGENEERVG